MKLDKKYDQFVGLDTRSNALVQPAGSVRRGSKNWRYNFQNELQQSNGWQHKSEALTPDIVGLVEYKYQDINTGEGKSQILAVCNDGNLYRRQAHYLKFTDLGGQTDISMFYNEVDLKWNFVCDGAATIVVAVDETTTMDALKNTINAGTGATCVVVDENGDVVTSSNLAYLINVMIDRELVVDEVMIDASSWSFTKVVCPSQDDFFPVLPFPITEEFYNSSQYEGISYVNQYNACYITDGGFPIKYDGYQCYRMGMPRCLSSINSIFGASMLGSYNFSNFFVEGTTIYTGTSLTAGDYKYMFQFGFVDSSGAETVGVQENEELGAIYVRLISSNAINISQGYLESGTNFPVWACKIDGNQNLTISGGTITVDTGHNIKVGMLLRIPISNESRVREGFSYIMAYVSAVTATTITVDYGVDPDVAAPYENVYPFQTDPVTFTGDITSGTNTILNVAGITNKAIGYHIIDTLFPFGTTITNVVGTTVTVSNNATGTVVGASFDIQRTPYLLADGSFLQGGYASDLYKNTITDIISGEEWSPKIHFGAFVRIWRSAVDTDTFYKLFDVPVSHLGGCDTILDFIPDSVLSIPYEDASKGGELPRACKYLQTWQNQLIQAGRPVDPSVANDSYPSATSLLTIENQWSVPPNTYFGYIYSEAGLCDFQSYYWNDPVNPEGFPTSGLYENSLISPFNDKIKGMGTNKDAMFVMKERTTAIVTGTLATGELVQEFFEEDVGCANHRTIQNVDGAVVWLDPLNGFYSAIAGRIPVPIGYSISDEFKKNPDGLDFNRSFAANFENENLYFCVVDTKMFVLDYAKTSNNSNRMSWYLWDSLSATSLLATADSEMVFADSDRAWLLKLTGTKYDMSNHISAIDFIYLTSWQNYGLPSIDKHFVRVWFNSIQGDFSILVSEYGNYNELASLVGAINVTFPAQTANKLTTKQFIKASYPKLSGYSLGLTNSTINSLVRIQGFEIELEGEYDVSEPKV